VKAQVNYPLGKEFFDRLGKGESPILEWEVGVQKGKRSEGRNATPFYSAGKYGRKD